MSVAHSKKLVGWSGGTAPGKYCNLYPHFSLETVFSALKTSTKLLYKYEQSFLEN